MLNKYHSQENSTRKKVSCVTVLSVGTKNYIGIEQRKITAHPKVPCLEISKETKNW